MLLRFLVYKKIDKLVETKTVTAIIPGNDHAYARDSGGDLATGGGSGGGLATGGGSGNAGGPGDCEVKTPSNKVMEFVKFAARGSS